MIVETDQNADWLKKPSEVAISAGHPEWTPQDVMRHLERGGLTGTYLYKRFKADPNFEAKIGRRRASLDKPDPGLPA